MELINYYHIKFSKAHVTYKHFTRKTGIYNLSYQRTIKNKVNLDPESTAYRLKKVWKLIIKHIKDTMIANSEDIVPTQTQVENRWKLL